MISTLNKHLQTTEINMCNPNGTWSQINPGQVPARNLKIHNLKLNTLAMYKLR